MEYEDQYPTIRELLEDSFDEHDKETIIDILESVHDIAMTAYRKPPAKADYKKALKIIMAEIEEIWENPADNPRANGWVDDRGRP